MSKVNTPITREDKSLEIARSQNALNKIKQTIQSISQKGKQVYFITINGTTIQTTDTQKWNTYFGDKQVKTI